ncbi:S9 family peptidase [Phenylobacterium sp. J367]|uniref:alpha/beta hydrolase family protein n=1 Tax=Phenylobacterium sp. J367 TaxID=2898435 RepID=UPI0021518D95|nr:S9 family peptidase [Phenylobacterium sp. J367]MCR5880785.1 S9 family peptidase [Phenylobacterium sp. J367]
MKLFASAAVAALLACAPGFVTPAWAAPPPASAFGRIPVIVDAEISPNGQRVAILGGTSEQRVVSIATVDQQGMPVVQLGAVEAVDLRWAGDDHVLARIAGWRQLGPRVAYRFERNFSISAEGKVVGQLLPGDAASSWLTEQPVLGVTASAPTRVLVGGLAESNTSTPTDTRMARKDDAVLTRVIYNVDPSTGRGRIVERGNPDTWTWEVDNAGEPRVRLEIDALNDRFSVHGKPRGRNQYSLLWSGDSFESRRLYYGYSEPDDAIYLAMDGRLVRKRLADGAVEPLTEPVATNPTLLWDAHRNTAAAVLTGAERPTYQWLDPEVGVTHAALTRVFKAQDVEPMSWSADRTRFVLRVQGPGAAPVWYLFDKTRKELSPLGDEYPELKGVALGTTRWITYKARDGLEIPAYVTLPPGAPATGGKLPLIVLPHGGPQARDTFSFDYLAQFLATRGYAVIQPQFRGSWGSGSAFEAAGDGEWGGKIQTDLLDGVAALAADGQIDPKRVCIVGASFGGYSALAGATLQPDAYRCAAAISGIGDLGLFLVEKGRTSGRDSIVVDEWRRRLGKADLAKLQATSPARQAAKAGGPILLIHGEQDTVVPAEQSQSMADALKAAGKPYELVLLPDENHYFTKAANRTRMLEAIEAFLAKNLPVAN